MSLQASEEELRGWISANGIGIQNDILDGNARDYLWMLVRTYTYTGGIVFQLKHT